MAVAPVGGGASDGKGGGRTRRNAALALTVAAAGWLAATAVAQAAVRPSYASASQPAAALAAATTQTATTPGTTTPSTTTPSTTTPTTTTPATTATPAVPPPALRPRPRRKPNPYNVTTRLAVALVQKPVYRRPTVHSEVVKDLSFYTPDYEALQTYRFIAARRVGRTLWEHIDVPMRPNGQTGWVKRSWLGPVRTVHTLIVVKRDKHRLWVYRFGRLIFTSPVGVGNPASGWSTPPGHFWIDEGFTSTDPFYGPWAFGTTDYSNDTQFPDGSIVGIHGTNAPWLIPGNPSHGCVRLRDTNIVKLKPLVGIGTAVWIE